VCDRLGPGRDHRRDVAPGGGLRARAAVAFSAMNELTSRADELYLKVTQLREHL